MIKILNFIFIFLIILNSCKEDKKIVNEYFSDGSLKVSFSVLNGKKNGKYTEYYKNKNIKKSCIYVNDTLEGVCKEFYINKNLKSEYFYRKGSEYGEYSINYENGNSKEIGFIRNDSILYYCKYSKYQILTDVNVNYDFPLNDTVSLNDTVNFNIIVYAPIRKKLKFHIEISKDELVSKDKFIEYKIQNNKIEFNHLFKESGLYYFKIWTKWHEKSEVIENTRIYEVFVK